MVQTWTLWLIDGFWGRSRQRAFYDVRVFNPFAQCHCNSTLVQCYRKEEQEKKRAYEERIREVEHGSFSPILHLRWNGSNCHSCLSTYCFHDGRETWWTIQPNPLLAEVSAELLATPLSNSMPVRCPLITRTTGSVWCSPLDLLRRSSPYGLRLTPLLFMYALLLYVFSTDA